MTKYAKKNTRTTIIEMKARSGKPRHVIFKSFEGVTEFEETMPGFHEPGWASWCAFRLLPPVILFDFERELAKLFEEFKKGDRKWILYNEEKRILFHRFLMQPVSKRK